MPKEAPGALPLPRPQHRGSLPQFRPQVTHQPPTSYHHVQQFLPRPPGYQFYPTPGTFGSGQNDPPTSSAPTSQSNAQASYEQALKMASKFERGALGAAYAAHNFKVASYDQQASSPASSPQTSVASHKPSNYDRSSNTLAGYRSSHAMSGSPYDQQKMSLYPSSLPYDRFSKKKLAAHVSDKSSSPYSRNEKKPSRHTSYASPSPSSSYDRPTKPAPAEGDKSAGRSYYERRSQRQEAERQMDAFDAQSASPYDRTPPTAQSFDRLTTASTTPYDRLTSTAAYERRAVFDRAYEAAAYDRRLYALSGGLGGSYYAVSTPPGAGNRPASSSFQDPACSHNSPSCLCRAHLPPAWLSNNSSSADPLTLTNSSHGVAKLQEPNIAPKLIAQVSLQQLTQAPPQPSFQALPLPHLPSTSRDPIPALPSCTPDSQAPINPSNAALRTKKRLSHQPITPIGSLVVVHTPPHVPATCQTQINQSIAASFTNHGPLHVTTKGSLTVQSPICLPSQIHVNPLSASCTTQNHSDLSITPTGQRGVAQERIHPPVSFQVAGNATVPTTQNYSHLPLTLLGPHGVRAPVCSNDITRARSSNPVSSTSTLQSTSLDPKSVFLAPFGSAKCQEPGDASSGHGPPISPPDFGIPDLQKPPDASEDRLVHNPISVFLSLLRPLDEYQEPLVLSCVNDSTTPLTTSPIGIPNDENHIGPERCASISENSWDHAPVESSQASPGKLLLKGRNRKSSTAGSESSSSSLELYDEDPGALESPGDLYEPNAQSSLVATEPQISRMGLGIYCDYIHDPSDCPDFDVDVPSLSPDLLIPVDPEDMSDPWLHSSSPLQELASAFLEETESEDPKSPPQELANASQEEPESKVPKSPLQEPSNALQEEPGPEDPKTIVDRQFESTVEEISDHWLKSSSPLQELANALQEEPESEDPKTKVDSQLESTLEENLEPPIEEISDRWLKSSSPLQETANAYQGKPESEDPKTMVEWSIAQEPNRSVIPRSTKRPKLSPSSAWQYPYPSYDLSRPPISQFASRERSEEYEAKEPTTYPAKPRMSLLTSAEYLSSMSRRTQQSDDSARSCHPSVIVPPSRSPADSSPKKIGKNETLPPLTIDTSSSPKADPEKPSIYMPTVEPISPTSPPDQAGEDGNDAGVAGAPKSSAKDTLLIEIARVDREINKTEHRVISLKRKQSELEQKAKKSETESSDETTEAPLPQHFSLSHKVYSENRRKAKENHAAFSHLGPSVDLPLYNQPSDTTVYQENKVRHLLFKGRLIAHLRRRRRDRHRQEKEMTSDYAVRTEKWNRLVEKLENSPERKRRDVENRELFEKVFPKIRKEREDRERFLRVGSRVKSDADLEEIMDNLHEQEMEVKKMRDYAAVPPMLLSAESRRCVYVNTNGRIEDLATEYKERRLFNIWTDPEKDIFREKYLLYPKNFGAIASFLERKSVSDCVQYYYLSKKTENYKRLLKKSGQKSKSGRNRNKTAAPPPLDPAPASTPPAPTIAPRFQRDYKPSADVAQMKAEVKADVAQFKVEVKADAPAVKVDPPPTEVEAASEGPTLAPPLTPPAELAPFAPVAAVSPGAVPSSVPSPAPDSATPQVQSQQEHSQVQQPREQHEPSYQHDHANTPPQQQQQQHHQQHQQLQQLQHHQRSQQPSQHLQHHHQLLQQQQFQRQPHFLQQPHFGPKAPLKPLMIPHLPDIPIVVIDDSDDSNSGSHFPYARK